jgi:hypothetical protein
MAKRRGINKRGDTSRYMEELANMERRANLPSAEISGIESNLSRLGKHARDINQRFDAIGRGDDVSPDDLEKFGFKGSQLEDLVNGQPIDRQLAMNSRLGISNDLIERRRQALETKRSDVYARQHEVASKQFQSRVMSMSRPERLEADTRAAMDQGPAIARAQNLSKLATDTQIRDSISGNRRMQTQLSDQMIEAAKMVGQPGGKESFLEIAGKLEAAKVGGAGLMGALQKQKREGTDILGRSNTVDDIMGGIQNRRYSEGIAGRVSAGNTGSINQEMGKLRQAEDAFVAAAEKFKKSLEDTGDATKELREEVDASSKAYKEQKDLVGEMNKQGRGRGGSSIPALLGIASAGADVARYGFVTSNMDKLAAQTGLANSVNAESMDVFSATQGDQAALRRISGSYSRNRRGGVVLGGRESTIQTAEGLLQAADAVSKGYGSMSNASLGGAMSGGTATIAAALDAGAPMAAQAAKTGINVAKGINAAMTMAQRQQLGIGLEDAINAVPDLAQQTAFSFKMGMRGSTIGMGGNRGSVFDMATSADQTTQMNYDGN